MTTIQSRVPMAAVAFTLAAMVVCGCSEESPNATGTAQSTPSAAAPAGKDTPTLPPLNDAAPRASDARAATPAESWSTASKGEEAVPPAVDPATQVQPAPPTDVKDLPKPPPVPKWTPPADTKSVTFLGLTAPKPATWLEHPPQSAMETTRLTVPGSEGSDAATIVVFYFGQELGGTNEANIDRWAAQFKSADGGPVEPKTETLESDGMPITIVELQGQYLGMGAASFTPDHMMISAIIDAPAGKVFIRFVGQNTTVNANREAYLHMLKNLKRVDEISK